MTLTSISIAAGSAQGATTSLTTTSHGASSLEGGNQVCGHVLDVVAMTQGIDSDHGGKGIFQWVVKIVLGELNIHSGGGGGSGGNYRFILLANR